MTIIQSIRLCVEMLHKTKFNAIFKPLNNNDTDLIKYSTNIKLLNGLSNRTLIFLKKYIKPILIVLPFFMIVSGILILYKYPSTAMIVFPIAFISFIIAFATMFLEISGNILDIRQKNFEKANDPSTQWLPYESVVSYLKKTNANVTTVINDLHIHDYQSTVSNRFKLMNGTFEIGFIKQSSSSTATIGSDPDLDSSTNHPQAVYYTYSYMHLYTSLPEINIERKNFKYNILTYANKFHLSRKFKKTIKVSVPLSFTKSATEYKQDMATVTELFDNHSFGDEINALFEAYPTLHAISIHNEHISLFWMDSNINVDKKSVPNGAKLITTYKTLSQGTLKLAQIISKQIEN